MRHHASSAAHAVTRVRRVLLVDDSPKMRRTIREIVEEAGARVEECSDGDEVLEAFERFVPDLVLMDVRMARVDGLAETFLLKERHPEASVVVVTEIDQPDLRSGATEAGAEAFVSKTDLLVLRDLVERRR